MRHFFAAAAAAALVAAPIVASATALPAIKVDLAGVKLDTEAGAKTALKRIEQAARQACDSTPTGTRIKRVDAECAADLVSAAVAKLNTPTVSALHKTGDQIRLARREQ